VHSPKCGSGNRPIDKVAAVQTLRLLLARDPSPAPLPRSPSKRSPPESSTSIWRPSAAPKTSEVGTTPT
jgi:DEAD/DEAH box helicase domain-containing protein